MRSSSDIDSPISLMSPDRADREDGEEFDIAQPPVSHDTDMSWGPVEIDRVGAAFYNDGNFCYLNASLQVVVHTTPLILQLRSSFKWHSCEDRDYKDGNICWLCVMRWFVESCMEKSGHSVTPLVFTSNLSKISKDLYSGRQEDAHEFLRCLLDNLHNCCLDPSSKEKAFPMDQDSLVKQVYGGRLVNQLRCTECGDCSNNPEPLLDLSLDIAGEDSLLDALESYTKMERIDNVSCEKCKVEVTKEKQIMIDRAPQVISLHLKRFKNDMGSTEKINKFVNYPLELDLKPFISCPNDDEQTMYDLYAVLVHTGEKATYGHYYSIVRSSQSTWHVMDDDRVKAVSERYVLNEKAYILFYMKKGSAPWFSELMEAPRMHYPSPLSVLDSRNNPTFTEETCSSSSSRETSEKDEVTCPQVDTPCHSTTCDPRGTALHSGGSRETAERDEGPSPHNGISPNSVTSKPESGVPDSLRSGKTTKSDEGPSPYNNISNLEGKNDFMHTPLSKMKIQQSGMLPTSRLRNQSKKRSSPDHISIDMFDDLYSDEKENLRPQGNNVSRGRDIKVRETTPKTPKNIDPSLSRMLRGFNSTRRAGLLSCLPQESKHMVNKSFVSRSVPDKRMKAFEFNPDENENQYKPKRGLSPAALKRGLFTTR